MMFLSLLSLYAATGLSAADSRRILNDMEVEYLLIFLLSHSNVRVQVAAARAVAAMAENLVSRDAFGKLGYGCFRILVHLFYLLTSFMTSSAVIKYCVN